MSSVIAQHTWSATALGLDSACFLALSGVQVGLWYSAGVCPGASVRSSKERVSRPRRLNSESLSHDRAAAGDNLQV